MNGSYFYVAKVTDNQDPEKLNRVKVTVPLAEDSVSFCYYRKIRFFWKFLFS